MNMNLAPIASKVVPPAPVARVEVANGTYFGEALKRGGADDPSNMQWQTTSEAKAKDARE